MSWTDAGAEEDFEGKPVDLRGGLPLAHRPVLLGNSPSSQTSIGVRFLVSVSTPFTHAAKFNKCAHVCVNI